MNAPHYNITLSKHTCYTQIDPSVVADFENDIKWKVVEIDGSVYVDISPREKALKMMETQLESVKRCSVIQFPEKNVHCIILEIASANSSKELKHLMYLSINDEFLARPTTVIRNGQGYRVVFSITQPCPIQMMALNCMGLSLDNELNLTCYTI
jgi:hypothetical protein